MTWSPLFSDVTPGPDVHDDAGAFVAEDHREQALGIGARARELVRVADARGLDFDQDFAGLRAVEIHRFDDEGLAGFVADGGAGLHRAVLRSVNGITPEPSASKGRCSGRSDPLQPLAIAAASKRHTARDTRAGDPAMKFITRSILPAGFRLFGRRAR